MAPAAVAAAMARLDAEGVARLPYTCQISCQREEILLLGERLAARLAAAMPEAVDAADARMLAGLSSSELCACDVATLTGLADDEVIGRLQAFAAQGLLVHRKLNGMHHYRLASEQAQRRIEAFTRQASPRPAHASGG